MTIYEVWDHDAMDGSMGSDYIAARYMSRDAADADANQRNHDSRLRFERNATNGKDRAERETWCWKHAYVKVVEVNE